MSVITNRNSQTDNKLVILLYHGVTNSVGYGIENSSGKHIDKKLFNKQMRFIKNNCNVLSMDEVIDLFVSKTPIPANAVAVTFDDGFTNNFTDAAQILDDIGVPATFYITTGMIGTNQMFWVDQLETCINLSTKKNIEVCLGDNRQIFQVGSYKDKVNSLNVIKTFCKNIHKDKKDLIVENVISETGVFPNSKQSLNYRVLTWNEVKQMNTNPLFSFGGHNVTHDTLSYLNHDEAVEQISGSINALKKNLGEDIVHYSYPEGQANHFNNSTIIILKANGIRCCPSAINGVNMKGDDLFHLQRTMVGMSDIVFPWRFNND